MSAEVLQWQVGCLMLLHHEGRVELLTCIKLPGRTNVLAGGNFSNPDEAGQHRGNVRVNAELAAVLTFVEEAIEGAKASVVGGELVSVKCHQQPRSRRIVFAEAVATQFIVPLVSLVHGRAFQVQVQTHVVDAPTNACVTTPLVAHQVLHTHHHHHLQSTHA